MAIVLKNLLLQLELQPTSKENNIYFRQLDTSKDFKNALIGLKKRLKKLKEYILKL
jgi:hypothetical protein